MSQHQYYPVMPPPAPKPIVIGLYGISGSGKTTLLKQLQVGNFPSAYSFYEGSAVLSDVIGSGGLEGFAKMDLATQSNYRQQAIESIQTNCQTTGTTGIVTGHGTLWKNGSVIPITTPFDLQVYTHIIYLDVPAQTIWQRSKDDTNKVRQDLSVEELGRWQETERELLRNNCIANGILFCSLRTPDLERVKRCIANFRTHTEKSNLQNANKYLEDIRSPWNNQLSTVLVFDADKTLTAEDTGALFWEKRSNLPSYSLGANPLERLFSAGYSHEAFRQATLFYEEACNDEEYETLCDQIASDVKMYPEFVSLLQLTARHKTTKAVIITSGLRRIWRKILEREGLSASVLVIGGGRLSDDLVVTAHVKTSLVTKLREFYGFKTWVFGDSPLDIGMLISGDRAVVVVGDEKNRSKSMETELLRAVEKYDLQAYQAVFPETSPPRLDTTNLPVIQLTSPAVINEMIGEHPSPKPAPVLWATDSNAAKLLMTPMRDADISGLNLREAHHRVGWYLATQYLSMVVGLEEHPITHVNGTTTAGHRFRHEAQTTIVALMRGGEPMAFGVNAAAPTARFMHASTPGDISSTHLAKQITVVLVDSVINSGKTVLEFLDHIRGLHASIHVVVIAGVVQKEFVDDKLLDRFANVALIALRISENKYTGSGGTDTGNRLFNTTFLK